MYIFFGKASLYIQLIFNDNENEEKRECETVARGKEREGRRVIQVYKLMAMDNDGFNYCCRLIKYG